VTPFDAEEIAALRDVQASDYQRFIATIDAQDATIADLTRRLDGLRNRLLAMEPH
jgi:hypothetical protein